MPFNSKIIGHYLSCLSFNPYKGGRDIVLKKAVKTVLVKAKSSLQTQNRKVFSADVQKYMFPLRKCIYCCYTIWKTEILLNSLLVAFPWQLLQYQQIWWSAHFNSWYLNTSEQSDLKI